MKKVDTGCEKAAGSLRASFRKSCERTELCPRPPATPRLTSKLHIDWPVDVRIYDSPSIHTTLIDVSRRKKGILSSRWWFRRGGDHDVHGRVFPPATMTSDHGRTCSMPPHRRHFINSYPYARAFKVSISLIRSTCIDLESS